MGWNIEGIANDIRKALSVGYHATEKGLYDLARASGTAGYEVGTALRTGHFIPLSEAYRESGQLRENVPFLGNVSGKQFAKIGASFATQALPIIGTFGHLASHPNENAFQKASDVIFGIADVLPFAGELASVSRVGESSLSAVANSLRNSLAKGVQNDVAKRIEHFISPISKDIKIMLPLQKDVFKTIRNGIENLIHPPVGKVIAGLTATGVGLSVLGGLTSSSSSGSSSSGSGSSPTETTGTPSTGSGSSSNGATGCDPTCGGNPSLPPCPQCRAMNAGSVLQSQLQALSSSGPQTPTMPSYASTPSSTPSSTSHSIFSNPILLIGITIVVIVIILIVVMR